MEVQLPQIVPVITLAFSFNLISFLIYTFIDYRLIQLPVLDDFEEAASTPAVSSQQTQHSTTGRRRQQTFSLLSVFSFVLLSMGAGGLASIVFIAIGTIAFSIAGAGGDDDTLMSTAVRFPAQRGENTSEFLSSRPNH
uniref:Uncharacterized protein n=1 Tax=Lactuca sativa TaxID=4236 RepID=A0A9R1VG55_LACSA|nr:hypothetical protein LSAT_V11C500276090 [Lactuca sativa]